MATIKDLEDLLNHIAAASDGMTLDEFKRAILGEVQQRFRGDKIYVPETRVSKKEAIIEAARKLPAGVVAERFGVSHSYVCGIMRRGDKN